MTTLLTLTDASLGFDHPAPAAYRDRFACRAVVFDADGKIAMIHSTVHDYYKIPGGGVEAGEDLLTALAREVMEEIGCAVGNVRELGIVDEHRNTTGVHQVSYCYAADLVGEKGQPQMTDKEKLAGFEPIWLDLAQAIALLEGGEHSGDNSVNYEFVRARELAILKAAT